jgi:hypothetical protein
MEPCVERERGSHVAVVRQKSRFDHGRMTIVGSAPSAQPPEHGRDRCHKIDDQPDGIRPCSLERLGLSDRAPKTVKKDRAVCGMSNEVRSAPRD